MKVCVIGLGRSGTKAIYTLLQAVMSDNHNQVDFVYEPFLWDKDTFNGKFSLVKERFGTMNSLSYEGIYNHLSLPLLIREPKPFANNSFLQNLFFPSIPGQNLLSKFIRANGRIRLLKAICPELKFIFVIRNPLDTVNSILNRFSFYGGEFHRDDRPRFLRESEEEYRNLPFDLVNDSLVAQELQFWYVMNHFALETIRQEPTDTLTLCLENYALRAENQTRKVCEFLGYKYQEKYKFIAREKVGVINNQFDIAREEFDHAIQYLVKYPVLLEKFGIDHEFDLDNVVKKYNVRNDIPVRTRPYYGYTPLRIIREFQKQSLKSTLPK
jgi:hypothetical protein